MMALRVTSVLSILVALSLLNISVNAIIEGSDAFAVKFPYLVALRRKACALCAFEHFASGAIYSKNIVITTANAVRENEPHRLMVVVGSMYRTGGDGLMYPVEKVVIHEDFHSMYLDNDIGLVKLKADLPLGESSVVQALRIAESVPPVGILGLVAGWGHTSEGGDYSEVLKQVEVPMIERESCQKSYQFTDVTKSMVCAGYAKGGRDACKGDAGSPLVVAQHYVGLVSWGIGCGRVNSPGVYTNLVHLRKWIEKTVSQM